MFACFKRRGRTSPPLLITSDPIHHVVMSSMSCFARPPSRLTVVISHLLCVGLKNDFEHYLDFRSDSRIGSQCQFGQEICSIFGSHYGIHIHTVKFLFVHLPSPFGQPLLRVVWCSCWCLWCAYVSNDMSTTGGDHVSRHTKRQWTQNCDAREAGQRVAWMDLQKVLYRCLSIRQGVDQSKVW